MSRNSNPDKKKKRRRRIIIGIIVVLVLAFFLWPADDEYDESVYDSAEVGEAASGSGANDREELAQYFGSDVVRDHYVTLKGDGSDTVTVMVYMNGSDLESEDNEATTDLTEMVKGISGGSDKVNIIVQTMGTKKWNSKYGISSKKTERYLVGQNGLTLVDGTLSQLDCTKASTLADFIKWGRDNYPANRNILLFWDHGGGAVYGFGNDEWVSDEYASLTIDEIQSALKEAGVYFDFIGMDCCIMSSLEVCCALYNYCDYTILSEDFESGLGWSYEGWIRALCANTSIDTKALGKIICDDMVKANTTDTDAGDNAILAVVDQSMIKLLYSCWKEFAYSSETELKSQNYSRSMKPKHGGRVHPALVNAYGTSSDNGGKSRFGFFSSLFGEDEASLSDYYEVDIMSAASSIDGEASDALKKAIANALVYVAYTSGDAHLTGLAVSLPYGDSEGYQSMQEIFSNVGMDDDYIEWLEQFVYIENSDNYYDYDSFDDTWYGWDSYEDQYDDDDISIWDIFFGDDYDDEYDDNYFDYDFDDMDYDDFFWNW